MTDTGDPRSGDLLYHFGPDLPGRISFVIGIPGMGIIIGLVAWSYPDIAGLIAVVGVPIGWYLWRFAFKSTIDIFTDVLLVETPVRQFIGSWASISNIIYRGHIVILSGEDRGFKVAQYSMGPQTDFIVKHTRWLSVYPKLEKALFETFKERRQQDTSKDLVSDVRWIWPSKMLWGFAVVVGIGVEILAILAKQAH